MENSLTQLQHLIDLTESGDNTYLNNKLKELMKSIVHETLLISRIHEN